MRTLTSNTLRFWQPGVRFLACLPLLAKCCLILQDQANILTKAKKKKKSEIIRELDSGKKNIILKMSAMLFYVWFQNPESSIIEAREGLKLFHLVIHLTSTVVRFPQNNLPEKDSLGTCYQELQEKKIRI